MEKEMLVVAKFKEGEGKFEKFMGFMQSPEGLAEREKVAVVEKTVASVTPDKSAVMFKIFCTDEAALHKFIEELKYQNQLWTKWWIVILFTI